MLTIILLTTVAFVAGFIDSISGGGGILTVPSLLLAGLPPHVALGTNKFMSTSGTAMALFNFGRNGKALWRIAIYGVPFALIGSALGARLVLSFNPETLGKMILVLLPIAVIFTLLPKKTAYEKSTFSGTELHFKIPCIGFFIGLYDGFFGPATGSFLILALYGMLHMNLVHASATAKIFNLAANVAALVTFIISGVINYSFAVPMAVANIAGNYLGSHLVIKKGQAVVQYALIVSFLLLFSYLMWRFTQ